MANDLSFSAFFEDCWTQFKEVHMGGAQNQSEDDPNAHFNVSTQDLLFTGHPNRGYVPDYVRAEGPERGKPTIRDEEEMGDYIFLQQIPPEYWRAAILWRNNEGALIESMRRRHAKGDHNVMRNFVPYLDLPMGKGYVRIYPDPNTLLGRHGFYIGLRNRIRAHERSPKLFPHEGKHMHPDLEGEGPALIDIDMAAKNDRPYDPETNPEGVRPHPEGTDAYPNPYAGRPRYHRSAYRHGKIDRDYSQAFKMTREEFDKAYPDEMFRRSPEDDAKTLKKRKEAAYRTAPHGFAGHRVMQGQVASDAMRGWLYLSALGAYQRPGNEHRMVFDPVRGEWVTPEEKSLPEINKEWKHPAVKGKTLPVIPRTIKTQVLGPGGIAKSSPQETVASVPVLPSSKFLPTVRASVLEKIAAATGKKVNKDSKNWLINVWNQLPPEEQQRLSDPANQRDLLDTLYYNYFPNLHKRYYKDDVATKENVVGGGVRAAQVGKAPTFATPEQYKAAVEKYRNSPIPGGVHEIKLRNDGTRKLESFPVVGLLGEADAGVQGFIGDARFDEDGERKRISPQRLQQLQEASGALTEYALKFLEANLEHPELGISDPEVGLTRIDPKWYDPYRNSRRRILAAYRMARDRSQSSLTPNYAGRRSEKRVGGTDRNLSAMANPRREGGGIEGNIHGRGEQQAAGEEGPGWWEEPTRKKGQVHFSVTRDEAGIGVANPKHLWHRTPRGPIAPEVLQKLIGEPERAPMTTPPAVPKPVTRPVAAPPPVVPPPEKRQTAPPAVPAERPRPSVPPENQRQTAPPVGVDMPPPAVKAPPVKAPAPAVQPPAVKAPPEKPVAPPEDVYADLSRMLSSATSLDDLQMIKSKLLHGKSKLGSDEFHDAWHKVRKKERELRTKS